VESKEGNQNSAIKTGRGNGMEGDEKDRKCAWSRGVRKTKQGVGRENTEMNKEEWEQWRGDYKVPKASRRE